MGFYHLHLPAVQLYGTSESAVMCLCPQPFLAILKYYV